MTRRETFAGLLSCLALPLFAAASVIDDAKKKIKDGKFEEGLAQLEAAFKANPKSDEIKNALAEAHFNYGESLMYAKDMPPMKKYPGALHEFRRTRELKPDHMLAKNNIDTIEGIYKSMGRPVPK
jgi:tetratricopeptide (TPR) repeat protein